VAAGVLVHFEQTVSIYVAALGYGSIVLPAPQQAELRAGPHYDDVLSAGRFFVSDTTHPSH